MSKKIILFKYLYFLVKIVIKTFVIETWSNYKFVIIFCACQQNCSQSMRKGL